MNRYVRIIALSIVAGAAIGSQAKPERSPYYIFEGQKEYINYAVGWPREYFHYTVVEGLFWDEPFQLKERPPSFEKRTELGDVDVGNLLIVIVWWSAVAGCVVSVLPLLQLRWNLKSLLLLQASIAVLVLLR